MQAPYHLITTGFLGSPMIENGGNQTHYFHIHPPVYYLFLAVIYKILGFGLFQARLASFILAMISLIILYQIGKVVLNNSPKGQIYFLILSAITPLFFVVSKTIRPDILMLLWFYLSYYYLLKWRTNPQRRYWIFGAVINGLMMMTHMYGIPIILLWYWDVFKRKQFTSLLWMSVLSVLVVLPYMFWISTDIHSFIYQVIGMRDATRIYIFQRILIFGKTLLMSLKIGSITYLLILGLIFGSFLPSFKNRPILKDTLFLFIFFCTQFLLLPKFNEFYFILMLPLAILIWMSLLSEKGGYFSRWVLIVFICTNIFGLCTYILKYKDFNYTQYKDQVLEGIPNVNLSRILGRVSMYPIFYRSKFLVFESGASLPYQKSQVDQVDYVIIDNYTMDNELKNYIIQKKHLIRSFISPYYGSEGQSHNNLIRIYH